jgi:2,3-bisphosphoglycerate-independent phosphoglycerate mutase
MNIGAGRVVYQDSRRSTKRSPTASSRATRAAQAIATAKGGGARCTSWACSPPAACTATSRTSHAARGGGAGRRPSACSCTPSSTGATRRRRAPSLARALRRSATPSARAASQRSSAATSRWTATSAGTARVRLRAARAGRAQFHRRRPRSAGWRRRTHTRRVRRVRQADRHRAAGAEPVRTIDDGDAVVFMNFRADRARSSPARSPTRPSTASSAPRARARRSVTLTRYGDDFARSRRRSRPNRSRNGFGEYLAGGRAHASCASPRPRSTRTSPTSSTAAVESPTPARTASWCPRRRSRPTT